MSFFLLKQKDDETNTSNWHKSKRAIKPTFVRLPFISQEFNLVQYTEL